jgi:hypothetical protein
MDEAADGPNSFEPQTNENLHLNKSLFEREREMQLSDTQPISENNSARKRDAYDDDEYFEEFERETTVNRPSDDEDVAREGSIIEASLNVLSRLSLRLPGASAIAGDQGRESLTFGRGNESVDFADGSASIAMRKLNSASRIDKSNNNEVASVVNALHGMTDTDVTLEHEHDEI